VIQSAAGSGGQATYPTLTDTNYIEWALVMKINLRAQGLWQAVSGEGAPSERKDMAALAALLRAVPKEMVPVLAVKDTTQEAWDAIRLLRMGVDRAREATAQRLRKEFEQITFKDGETLDAFGMRITTLANNLRSLGDTVEEVKVIQKFLREVPDQYSQMACSIETLLDLKGMSVEELIGRLRSSAERCSGGKDTSSGQLLLTEEEWMAWAKQREQGQGSSSGGAKDKKGKGKQQNRGRDGGRRDSGGERDMSKVKCYNFNKYNNHFSRDCPEPRCERKERANLAQEENNEPALLLASVCGLGVTSEDGVERVLLNEERSQARCAPQGTDCDTSWFLDTGASNHMMGRRDAFTELDTGITGTVKLGDGSNVKICERGTILFKCRNGEHRTLIEVYYLPRLQSNIVSIGQLDEANYETRIHGGVLRLWDPDGKLLTRV
jgi:hypothetical protein